MASTITQENSWNPNRFPNLETIVGRMIFPTPTCADATMGAILNDNTKLITLKSGRMRKISNQGVSGSIGLARTVAMWATPCASDNRDRGNLGSGAIQRRKEKGKQIMLSQSVSDTSGALNPPWVEWLMGWPLGWTDLKPLEMGRFLLWLDSHGIS
jgi:DNA (cytosine-5)-methyltransferase 1